MNATAETPLQLEPLLEYMLPARLVEQIYLYLGSRPAAEVEDMRRIMQQWIVAQQEQAARARLAESPPEPARLHKK